ncbi:MAG: hypothetical protein ABS54_04255 [Hyphomicrobium sp. SCN 65-11]|nr:MAG: hypothetical protein ABS54_04255 [Hyphomicrobium sp. SCN 65-11]
MASGLEGLQVNTWFKAVIVVSTVVLLAALAAKMANVALVATGTLVFGFGQWINHPKRLGYVPGYKITYTSRYPSFSGVLIELLGLALVFYGIWRLHTLGF